MLNKKRQKRNKMKTNEEKREIQTFSPWHNTEIIKASLNKSFKKLI